MWFHRKGYTTDRRLTHSPAVSSPSQIRGTLALVFESSAPLDMRAQHTVFSAVLRAHWPWGIGGGHGKGPLRVRPRFGAHAFPGLPECRRHLRTRARKVRYRPIGLLNLSPVPTSASRCGANPGSVPPRGWGWSTRRGTAFPTAPTKAAGQTPTADTQPAPLLCRAGITRPCATGTFGL
jgi:hypothetical protein